MARLCLTELQCVVWLGKPKINLFFFLSPKSCKLTCLKDFKQLKRKRKYLHCKILHLSTHKKVVFISMPLNIFHFFLILETSDHMNLETSGHRPGDNWSE